MRLKLTFLIFLVQIQLIYSYEGGLFIGGDTEQHEIKAMPKSVRGSKGWGFFAEFLWALNHIHYCITHNKVPVIYWGQSFAYYNPKGYNGSFNCWEYYFEPVSSEIYRPGDPIEDRLFYPNDNNFSTLWDYQQYIINLNLLNANDEIVLMKLANFPIHSDGGYPVGNAHLYSKTFRKYVKNVLLDNYIRIKENITKKIDTFYHQQMKGKQTIGIHLRGRFLWNESPFVEIQKILDYANQFADENTQFFIATDQNNLLMQAKKLLKGKVISYDSQRFDNSTAPVAGQAKLDPQLGENVLIETLLLSRCEYLIHGISNVSTAALYFNPELKHTLLY